MTSAASEPVEVLVLGASRSAVAAVRGLAAGGHRVGVARHRYDDRLATASRHCTREHLIADPQEDLEEFGRDLAEVCRTYGYRVVLPSADDYLAGLSSVRGELAAAVPLADHEAVLLAGDKLGLERLAVEAGFTAPETVPADEFDATAWDGPAIVKDRSHWRPGRGTSGRAPSAWVGSASEVEPAAAAIRAHGGFPIVQRPVTGVMHCVGAFRNPDGVVSGWIHQSSDHLWPLPMGTTSRAVTLGPDHSAQDRVERLLTSLGWIGMANFQMYRQADGGDVLIDLNGRFNHSLSLASAAGVDFPNAWVDVALGDTGRTLPNAREGERISMLVPDLKRARAERRAGLMHDALGTVWFALRAHHTIASWSDPGPSVQYVRDAIGRRRVPT